MTKRRREVESAGEFHDLVEELARELADGINEVGGRRVLVESELAVRPVEDGEGASS